MIEFTRVSRQIVAAYNINESVPVVSADLEGGQYRSYTRALITPQSVMVTLDPDTSRCTVTLVGPVVGRPGSVMGTHVESFDDFMDVMEPQALPVVRDAVVHAIDEAEGFSWLYAKSSERL